MIKFIRAVVRPIVTIYLVALIGLMWYEGKQVLPEQLALTGMVVGWWFYDRTKLHNAQLETQPPVVLPSTISPTGSAVTRSDLFGPN